MGDSFDQARLDVKKLQRSPSNDEVLQLYALESQSTNGDANAGDRPGMFDLKGRLKFDAWMRVTSLGLSKDEVEKKYVDLVEQLKESCGFDAD